MDNITTFIKTGINEITNKLSALPFTILGGIVYIILLVIAWFYIHSNNNESNYTKATLIWVSTIIGISIFMILLSIVLYAVNNFLNSTQDTYSSNNLNKWSFVLFIKGLILSTPCLIIDLVKYFISEYKLTTSPILILFILELLFILGYMYVDKILNAFDNSNSIDILTDSRFLDNPTTLPIGEYAFDKIGTFKFDDNLSETEKQLLNNDPNSTAQLKDGIAKTLLDKVTFKMNYGISAWIYINNSTNHISNELNIVNFADNLTRITSHYTSDETHVLRIHFNKNDGYYDLLIPYQKWMHLVLNYSSKDVDLFVNGNLERTFEIKNTPVSPNSSNSNIVIGQINGIDGAISNIKYHTNPLSAYQVAESYNRIVY